VAETDVFNTVCCGDRRVACKIKELQSETAASKDLFARRGGEFWEARIILERIEHRIEPEQRRRERGVARRQCALIGHRKKFL